jgi:hypothetical protein
MCEHVCVCVKCEVCGYEECEYSTGTTIEY